MNETSNLRRIAATSTIGSFSVAALMGILALLAGGSFGEGQGRVLLTTLVVGCASICALCYLATAGTRWAAVGAIGAVVLVLPVVTSLLLVWVDWDSFGDGTEGLAKAFGIGVVGAATLAQVCLLLAVTGDRRLEAVLRPTIAVATLVALVACGMILGAGESDGAWRLLGILAILDVLGTLVTIAMARFGDRPAPTTPDQRLRVTLSVEQSSSLRRLATGADRSPEQLVGEAVDRLLSH
jgi:signal transduction histidine kinase